MPHVSPLKGPLRSPPPLEIVETRMEDEDLLYTISEGRLTPRFFFICCLYDTYPIDEVFVRFEPGDRMGIMDINSMENEEFTNPLAVQHVKAVAMATDSSKKRVAVKVSPAMARLPSKVSSVLTSDVRTTVKPSVFDVISPPPKGAAG